MLFKTGKFAISTLIVGFIVALATFAQSKVPVIEKIDPTEIASLDQTNARTSAKFQLTRYIEPAGTDQVSIECDEAKKNSCLVVRRSNGDTVASQPIPRNEVKGLLNHFFKEVPADASGTDAAVAGDRKLATYEIHDEKKVFKGSVSDSILDEKTGQPSLAQVRVIDSVLSIEGKLLSRLQKQ